MLKNQSPPKEVVTCRVAPELKDQLQLEADERGISLSKYAEILLLHRNPNEDEYQELESLRQRVFELESEVGLLEKQLQADKGQKSDVLLNQELIKVSTENKNLKQRLMMQVEVIKQSKVENATLSKMQGGLIPHWMSEQGYKQTLSFLEQIYALKPLKAELLLHACLAVTLENQKSSFKVLTLTQFLSRNPNFSNLKLILSS